MGLRLMGTVGRDVSLDTAQLPMCSWRSGPVGPWEAESDSRREDRGARVGFSSVITHVTLRSHLGCLLRGVSVFPPFPT